MKKTQENHKVLGTGGRRSAISFGVARGGNSLLLGRATYDLRHTRPTFRLFDLRLAHGVMSHGAPVSRTSYVVRPSLGLFHLCSTIFIVSCLLALLPISCARTPRTIQSVPTSTSREKNSTFQRRFIDVKLSKYCQRNVTEPLQCCRMSRQRRRSSVLDVRLTTYDIRDRHFDISTYAWRDVASSAW